MPIKQTSDVDLILKTKNHKMSMSLKVLAVALALFVIGCNSDSSVEAEKTIEEKLAFIDDQEERADEYVKILDQLTEKCEEDRTLLADMSVKTTQLLAEKGVDSNALEILDAAYKSVEAYSEPQKCASAFALISTIVND